jgi:hypothetical protein
VSGGAAEALQVRHLGEMDPPSCSGPRVPSGAAFPFIPHPAEGSLLEAVCSVHGVWCITAAANSYNYN